MSISNKKSTFASEETNNNKTLLLSVVVPCHNEELVLGEFYDAVIGTINEIKSNIYSNLNYEFVFIDDGSADATSEKIKSLRENDPTIRLIKFSRNFGKEAAILAGLKAAKGDAVVLMDADLEHPPKLIPEMVRKWLEGYKIIYAKRTKRPGTNFLIAKFSELFYKIFNSISEVKIESGVTDFCLMDAQVVRELVKMDEYHRFSKSMFAWVGFKKYCLEFDHEPRKAGKTSWNFRKLFNYAIEGFVSFSTVPLRLAFLLGFLVSFTAFAYGAAIIFKTLIWGDPVSGYPTTIVVILFVGGIQLIVLGVIGEYIARIYEQSKNRPHYIVEETL